MTHRIALTQGAFALIDDCDMDITSARHWHAVKNGRTMYAATKIEGKRIWLHRFLTHAQPGFVVDHADGDGLNNRRHNLRVTTHRFNCANGAPRSRLFAFKGISRRGNKFVAQIANGKTTGARYLGIFATIEEAALAYDAAAVQQFGEFARLNFPEKATPSRL